jgi:hypothetical protein
MKVPGVLGMRQLARSLSLYFIFSLHYPGWPAPPSSVPIHGPCGRLRYPGRYRSLIVYFSHHPVAVSRLRALLNLFTLRPLAAALNKHRHHLYASPCRGR